MRIQFFLAFLVIGAVVAEETVEEEEELLMAPETTAATTTTTTTRAPVTTTTTTQAPVTTTRKAPIQVQVTQAPVDEKACFKVQTEYYKRHLALYREFQQKYAQLLNVYKSKNAKLAKLYKKQQAKVCRGVTLQDTIEGWSWTNWSKKQVVRKNVKVGKGKHVKKGGKKIVKKGGNKKIVKKGGKKVVKKIVKKQQKSGSKNSSAGSRSGSRSGSDSDNKKKVQKKFAQKKNQVKAVNHKKVNQKKIDALKVDDDLKRELKDLAEEADKIKQTGEDNKVVVATHVVQKGSGSNSRSSEQKQVSKKVVQNKKQVKSGNKKVRVTKTISKADDNDAATKAGKVQVEKKVKVVKGARKNQKDGTVLDKKTVVNDNKGKRSITQTVKKVTNGQVVEEDIRITGSTRPEETQGGAENKADDEEADEAEEVEVSDENVYEE